MGRRQRRSHRRAVAEVVPELLLPFSYEPIAVALVAVGVLYVVDETFVAVPRRWRTELVEQFDDPVVLVYRDVTDIERQRRERERQNEQLNDFSVALNHELRNAITVLGGFLSQASQSVTHRTVNFDSADITRADDALSRMQRVIEELTTLAQYGQTAETTTGCRLGVTAEAARAGSSSRCAARSKRM